MLSIKDLSKMTNAQLQGELKKRGLAEVGKKAELVERLSDAIRKEEEDAILNAAVDTGDLDADLSAAEALLLNEPEPETEETTSVSPVPADPIEEGKVDATTTEGQEKPAAGDEAKLKSVGDSADAKLKRAQRFGLPIGVPAATSVDAKQKRAERFGITPPVTSDDAKAKRAERFGVVAEEKNGKAAGAAGKEMGAEAKAARAARFGLNAGGTENTEKKEKLLARAQRFGIPVSAEGKVIAKQGPVDPEMDAKKKARAERFGLQQQ